MKAFIKVIILANLIILLNCSISLSTPKNSDGDGNVLFLDRHNISCETGTRLQSLSLTRPTSNSISYNYECIRSESTNSIHAVTLYTDWTKAASDDVLSMEKSADRLSNLRVSCDSDMALKEVQLESKCILFYCQIRYRYICAQTKLTSNCMKSKTKTIDAGDGSYLALSNLSIKVPKSNYVLTGFKLNSDMYFRWFNKPGKLYNYEYSYCEMQSNANNAYSYNSSGNLRNLEDDK